MKEASLEFCARASVAVGEPLWGSAPRADVWIVVEHTGLWEPAPLDSAWPDGVRARVEGWLAAIPHARLQLMRRPRGAGAERPRVIVAHSAGAAPWAAELSFDELDDLLALDVPAWVAGGHPEARPITEPLFLVCTHGRRDRCCAKWGIGLFSATAAAAPDLTWQTTHLGGHRFAPTMVALPHGVQYGRVAPETASAIVRAHQGGRVGPLEAVRGRTTLEPPAQVADVAVRERTGIDALDGVRIEETIAEGDGWRVTARAADGRRFAVRVAREDSGVGRAPSCGKPDEPMARYQVTDIGENDA